jgi:hypothetical protein
MVVPLNSERFADPLFDEAFDASRREAGKKVFFPSRESSCTSDVQLEAFRNQKKGRRFSACGRLNLVSSVNYKTSAQAGAATCQRQAQAFWFVQSFMSVYMIYARGADVNLLAASFYIATVARVPFRAGSLACNP